MTLLEVEALSKSYPGVRALDEVSLRLGAGEVLALVGENGAGKSTLLKSLAGIVAPDSGTLRLDGSDARFASPGAARDAGIALIHQELMIADNLSAAANVFLGREPRRFGVLRHAEITRRAGEVLRSVGADFGPDTPAGELSVGGRQLIEIARALSQEARVLIMDEPTSALSERDAARLLDLVRDLATRGTGILYVSHRLGEITALADRVSVLRDGRNAGELAGSDITREAMVRCMVGRDVAVEPRAGRVRDGAPALEVRDLVVTAHPEQRLSFDVRAGEVVGLAGLVGSGRTELLCALFGVEPPLAGTLCVRGRELVARSPEDAIRAGLALVPEDRKERGLLLDWGLRDNVALPGFRTTTPRGVRSRADERTRAERVRERLRIKVSDVEQPLAELSGGNQQKACLAKWIALEPAVFLLDEPTRGVDVGARQEIYARMDELAAGGAGVLFASSETEEILALSDRVLVLQEGRLAGELSREELSEEALLDLAHPPQEVAP